VNVLFTRTEEIQKVHAHVFACLAYAQENQVFPDALLGGRAFNYVPEFGERFDSVFGVVVVPRNAVEVQKREQFVPVLLETITAGQGCRTFVFGSNHLTIEAVHCDNVLSQEVLLQTMTVNVLHDDLQELPETLDEVLQLLVVRIVQHRAVQISHKMDQAFLLRTSERIIDGVKIRHENTLKST